MLEFPLLHLLSGDRHLFSLKKVPVPVFTSIKKLKVSRKKDANRQEGSLDRRIIKSKK